MSTKMCDKDMCVVLYFIWFQDIARLFRAKKDHVRVTLVESHQILAAFDEKLRNYAEQKIKGRQGFTLKNNRVTGSAS